MRLLLPWLTLTLTLHCCVAGAGRVKVWQDEDREIQGEAEMAARASEIAAALVAPLRQLEASLDRWRPCLERRTCGADEFLDRTESALLAILGAPELAGLRDWVREEFRQARGEAQRETAAAAFSASGAPGRIRHAALARAAAGGFFDRVLSLVRRPRELAERNDLITDLCLRSRPEGAQFVLWPSSEPSRGKGGTSTGRLVIHRGLYAYEVKRGKRTLDCDPDGGTRRCARVDLVNDPQPVFFCTLDGDGDAGCTRQPGPLDGCRP